MRLDPQKVNVLLGTVPMKLIEGTIENFSIKPDLKNMKASISIEAIHLRLYLDDHSQYQRFKQSKQPEYIVRFSHQESFSNNSDGDNSSKDESFLNNLLSSFELSFSLDKLTLEIKTEKQTFNSSILFTELNSLKLCKPKQKTVNIMQSITVSIQSLNVDIKEMCAQRSKLMSMRRVRFSEQPVKCSEFLHLAVDIFKADPVTGVKKVAVRCDIGSIQSIVSISNLLTFISIGEKLTNYMNRQKFMNEDIINLIQNILSFEEEQIANIKAGLKPLDAAAEEEMFHSVIDNYKSNVFTSVTQSLVGGSFRPASQPEQEPLIDVESIKEQVKSSQLDIEVEFQGVYLGVLKESNFDTSEYFSWVNEVYSNNLQFTEVIGSYILVSLEKIHLAHNDVTSNYCLSLSQVRIDDCVLREVTCKPEDSFENRVSIGGIEPDQSMMNEAFHSFVDTSIKYDTFNLLRIEDKTNIVVKYDVRGVLKLSVEVSVIVVNIDIKAITIIKNRKGLFEDIMKAFEELDATQKAIESDKHNWRNKYYDGMDGGSMRQILEKLLHMAAELNEPKIKSRMMKLLDIQDASGLSPTELPKIELLLKGLKLKVGGVLDQSTSQIAYVSLHANHLSIVLNKQIVVSWKNTIDLKIEDAIEQRLIVSVLGDKENVIGIDNKKMAIKITGVDVNFSPQIFESLLVFSELLNGRINKLEMGSNKFKLLKHIEELRRKRSRAYTLFDEELLINETAQKIALKLIEVPPLVEKVYFYLGRIGLRVYDKELTNEIIESAIEQRKRTLAVADNWIVVKGDDVSDLKTGIEDDIQKRQAMLSDLKCILHLELKPIMMILGLKNNNDFRLMIHTILLRDGATDALFEKNKLDYKTVFCEVYSINYNQPVYDAKLQGTFQIKKALEYFNHVLKEFESKGAFIDVNKKTKEEIISGKKEVEVSVKMSSFVARFAMQTPTETFVCFIKLIDSTLQRLETLKEQVLKLQQQEEQEVQNFRKQKEEKQKKISIEPVKENSTISIELDRIYFDVFHQEKYRVLLQVSKSTAKIINKELQPTKITAELSNIRLSFTNDKECYLQKTLDLGLEKNKKYFSLFKLKMLLVNIITLPASSNEGVDKTEVDVFLPQIDHNNLIVRLDIDSLTVLLDLSTLLNRLIESSKLKTKVIFRNNSEHVRKKNIIENTCVEDDEFVIAGLKLEECNALREAIQEINCLSHSTDRRDKADREATTNSKRKKAKQLLDMCTNIQSLPRKKSETVVNLHVDKITINIFQAFEIEGPSFISVGIIDTLVAMKINDSSEPLRDGERTSSMLQALISISRFRIIDKTKLSMFKFLINIPKHSLNLYLKMRTVSDKKPLELQPSKYRIECTCI